MANDEALVIVLGNEVTHASYVTKTKIKNISDGPYSNFLSIISYSNNKYLYSHFATSPSLALEDKTCRNFINGLLDKAKKLNELTNFQLLSMFLSYIYKRAQEATKLDKIKTLYLYFPFWTSTNYRKYLKSAAQFAIDGIEIKTATFPYSFNFYLYDTKNINPEEKILYVDFGATNTEFFILNSKKNDKGRTFKLHSFATLNFGGDDFTNIISNLLKEKLINPDLKFDDPRIKRAFWEGANHTKEVFIDNAKIPFNPVAITHVNVQTSIDTKDFENDESYKRILHFLKSTVEKVMESQDPKYFVFLGGGCHFNCFADAVREEIKRWIPEIEEIHPNSTIDFKKEACSLYVQQILNGSKFNKMRLSNETRKDKKYMFTEERTNIFNDKTYDKPVKFNEEMTNLLRYKTNSRKYGVIQSLKEDVENAKPKEPEVDLDSLQNDVSGVIIAYNNLIGLLDLDEDEVDEDKCESEDINELQGILKDLREKALNHANENIDVIKECFKVPSKLRKVKMLFTDDFINSHK
ncbi:hypothetical protein TVAG_184200 [Trichomonas vaginalis G3]|uniref:DnaK protein n=1 Tax=Trichomonas vaginalis (strain ATCC PRA-98 / G3) TaxID=412133 RepID=A2E9V6_TRIV3|nr:hypothetical protein TVAGG3_0221330 [Trichomonas vaginalis G3]EAY10518.1 hypothetical protein TVAG_184200 [Trichomonas vaginalis G3]KAI5551966.1 hypothetical protein TVAGG3_0221330 [Trichomonas vaginalis G3]|eukprot:XP_001322741.1 hypothetical protein [Trichomonas vaginalis G3]